MRGGETADGVRVFTVFYSWQSDRPPRSGRAFIRLALEAAAVRVGAKLGVVVQIDSDTQGVPGTPAINETILGKIERCDLFVGDMTFVAETAAGKKVTNPNVMAEYGYALRARTSARILLVMNTAHGPPEDLPFDLKTLRFPEAYALDEAVKPKARRRERAVFAERLERNLEAALRHQLAQSPPSDSQPDWGAAEAALTEVRNAQFLNAPVVVARPRLMVYFVPLAAVAGRPPSAATVKAARPYFPPDVETPVFEGLDTSQWWSHGPAVRPDPHSNPEAQWSVRILRPGMFEAGFTIGARVDDDRDILVDGRAVQDRLVAATSHLARLAVAVDLGGAALAAASLEGVEDVQLTRSRPGGRRIGRDSVALGVVRLVDPATSRAADMATLLDDLWVSSGWDDGAGG